MKTVIVPAPGKIEIRQVETPVINAYQALVKTEMVALCNATDSKLIAGKFPGVDTYPLALGHENAGIVIAVGEKVRNFKVGDRAIGGLISDFGAQGVDSGWGGFSEYVVVNDFEVLKEEGLATPEQGCWDSFEIQNTVPSHVQPEEAVISCTWREVLGAFKDFNLTPGKKVNCSVCVRLILSICFPLNWKLLAGWEQITDIHPPKLVLRNLLLRLIALMMLSLMR